MGTMGSPETHAILFATSLLPRDMITHEDVCFAWAAQKPRDGLFIEKIEFAKIYGWENPVKQKVTVEAGLQIMRHLYFGPHSDNTLTSLVDDTSGGVTIRKTTCVVSGLEDHLNSFIATAMAFYIEIGNITLVRNLSLSSELAVYSFATSVPQDFTKILSRCIKGLNCVTGVNTTGVGSYVHTLKFRTNTGRNITIDLYNP